MDEISETVFGANATIYRDDQGRLHNDDGPAVYAGSDQFWYRHGRLHREDGPAAVCVGRRSGKGPTVPLIESAFSPEEIGKSENVSYVGDVFVAYAVDGKLHCKGGPALVKSDGSIYRFENGQALAIPVKDGEGNVRHRDNQGRLHRDDGPAVELSSGDRAWYRHGKLHREGGLAVEGKTARTAEFSRNQNIVELLEAELDAVRCGYRGRWTEQEIIHGQLEKQTVAPFAKAVHAVDGVVRSVHLMTGRVEFLNEKGHFHREDGPALVTAAGDELWYQHGKLHREDGPAAILSADLDEGGITHAVNQSLETTFEARIEGLRQDLDRTDLATVEELDDLYARLEENRITGPATVYARNGVVDEIERPDLKQETGIRI